MDKLENETWEDYAFRNNLFVIKYADKEKTVIDDITMPIHTNITPRHTNAQIYHNEICYGNNLSFMEFIMHELYNLRDKYKMGWYCDSISYIKVELMTKEHEEDVNRQQWLFKQLAFWEKKYTENEIEKKEKYKESLMQKKKRYLELKTIISETHKDQIDEILTIVRGSSIPLLEGETESALYPDENYWKSWREKREKEKEREREKERENIQNKKERIELYEKYLKNKDIQTQIMELEQKLTQLKEQIVK